jgi:hypothetical protein
MYISKITSLLQAGSLNHQVVMQIVKQAENIDTILAGLASRAARFKDNSNG